MSAPITIGITVTFMFHSFFQFSSKVLVLISHFALFQFYSGISRNGKVHNSAGSLFYWLSQDLAIDPFVSQNPRELFEEFFTPVLADGFLLDFEVSSSFQHSSQYSYPISIMQAVSMVSTRPLMSNSSSPLLILWWLNQKHQL